MIRSSADSRTVDVPIHSIVFRGLVASILALAVAGCGTMGAAGPSALRVQHTGSQSRHKGVIQFVQLNNAVVHRLSAYGHKQTFAEALGDGVPVVNVIGKGDTIDVSIWESPPALLFGVMGTDVHQMAGPALAQGTNLPQQIVDNDGRIALPFVGSLSVAGRTTRDVEHEIVGRLAGKAHGPQAVVRLVQNETRTVTLVGEVNGSRRLPLTPRGERLLDAVAAAGGVRQPVGKTSIQISRGLTVATMPLDSVIKDPAQNIRLQPGDVVTALFQPFSFTALGASSLNAEIPFEGNGLTLSQALGRIGGLRDDRANIRGVFIFRFEDRQLLALNVAQNAQITSEGKVPTIYRVDLSDPSSFFLAQQFPIRDKDIIYVANAPGAELQKFVGIVSSIAFSAISVGNGLN